MQQQKVCSQLWGRRRRCQKDFIHAKATAEDVGMWATKTSNNVTWQQLVKRFDESVALHDISAIEKGMQEYVANRELYAGACKTFGIAENKDIVAVPADVEALALAIT